jgi:hypothetical protein
MSNNESEANITTKLACVSQIMVVLDRSVAAGIEKDILDAFIAMLGNPVSVTENGHVLFVSDGVTWPYVQDKNAQAVLKFLVRQPDNKYLFIRVGQDIGDIDVGGSMHTNPFNAGVEVKLFWTEAGSAHSAVQSSVPEALTVSGAEPVQSLSTLWLAHNAWNEISSKKITD